MYQNLERETMELAKLSARVKDQIPDTLSDRQPLHLRQPLAPFPALLEILFRFAEQQRRRLRIALLQHGVAQVIPE